MYRLRCSQKFQKEFLKTPFGGSRSFKVIDVDKSKIYVYVGH